MALMFKFASLVVLGSATLLPLTAKRVDGQIELTSVLHCGLEHVVVAAVAAAAAVVVVVADVGVVVDDDGGVVGDATVVVGVVVSILCGHLLPRSRK
jgi:hypothetical protein